jgi:hypothetical protein
MTQRDGLKMEPGGFPVYGKDQLEKINSMRRDKSRPDFMGVPILSDSAAMLVRASEMDNKPASCYTCQAQQSDKTCFLLGPSVEVRKVTGSRKSGDPIEYWPCCGMHNYGEPREGKPVYADELSSPASVGLIWINAAKVGQAYGGANCGGVKGGDDCDHYMVKGAEEKWDAESGYCRVLCHNVDGGDVCAAWHDDDELPFAEATMLIRGDSLDTVEKKRLVTKVIERED